MLDKYETIISLVPSWTEYICDLGYCNRLIARTEYCTQPSDIRLLPAIGGTKNPDTDRIISMSPDLIIANKEENKQYDINVLRAAGLTVFVSNAVTVVDAVEEMMLLEYMLRGKTENIISLPVSSPNQFTFLYLVWNDPIMAAGPRTYISHVIEYCGGENILAETDDRYPRVNPTELKYVPDRIYLPDEPYEFSTSNIEPMQKLFPDSEIILLDGKLASWYGLRLKEAVSFFSKNETISSS